MLSRSAKGQKPRGKGSCFFAWVCFGRRGVTGRGTGRKRDGAQGLRHQQGPEVFGRIRPVGPGREQWAVNETAADGSGRH